MSAPVLRAPATALAAVYGAVAEWFLYPEEVSPASLTPEAVAAVEEAAEAIDPRLAVELREFLAGREAVDPEAYLNLLELDPTCPLYLGSYQFAEPETCASAGVSERNMYMLEIGNIYRHFGLEPAGELPDFVPAVAEFLGFSASSEGSDDELRERLIGRMVLPGARLFAEKLESEEGPYRHLARAFVICLERDAAIEADEQPDLDAEQVPSVIAAGRKDGAV